MDAIVTPDYKLQAFDWLPLSQWTPETTFNFKMVDGKQNCKVCDEWVLLSQKDIHCAIHVAEKQLLIERIKAANAEEARERREWLAAEREALKPIKSEFYTAPCQVCNKPIPKTGRRGRPPIVHPECK